MRILRVPLAICALSVFTTAGLAGYSTSEHGQPSVCYGDAVSGRLERGTRLSYSGENYRAYSMLGFALGRTYVHSSVRDVMRDAYAELAKSHPDLRFIYGESGWATGGRFHPHKGLGIGMAAIFSLLFDCPTAKYRNCQSRRSICSATLLSSTAKDDLDQTQSISKQWRSIYWRSSALPVHTGSGSGASSLMSTCSPSSLRSGQGGR